MDRQEIENKVKQIITEELGCDESEITPTSRLIHDLGADSLDCYSMVMRLEEEFEIEIPDEEAERIITVQDAVNVIGAIVQKTEMVKA